MIELSGTMTVGDVVALADGREAVSVPATVLSAVEHLHHLAADLSTRYATYGRTTGVGANKIDTIPPDDQEYGMRLLRSHSVDAGDPLSGRTVRSMLAVRLIQLCFPGAGLDLRSSPACSGCSTTTHCPRCCSTPSIGTGDLAALAGTALTLIGERPATRDLTPMPPWGCRQRLAVHEQQCAHGGGAAAWPSTNYSGWNARRVSSTC